MSGNLLFFLVGGYCKVSSCLQISSIDFIIFAVSSLLKSLSLHKHRLLLLFEASFLLFEGESFIVFNDFHPSMLDGLTNKDL